jgi:hypothetical protein
MKQALVNVAATMRATGGDPFLRLLRDGTWVYGAENIEVEQGSQWAVNPNSLQHGYCCWSKGDDNDAGELLGEAMVSMFSPKPNLDDLPKYGFPWTEQIAFSLRCASGEDEGVQVQYKVTSKGGMNAARVLLQQLIKQVDADPANLVPLVELQSATYQHKKWGRIYTPVLTIAGWSNEQALAGDEPAETKAEEKKAPETVKRRNPAAAAPAPAPAAVKRRAAAPEPAKPVRRRRPS